MASKQIAKDLNGINTEVVIQTFADRILVLVTQLGKVGNLVNPIESPNQSVFLKLQDSSLLAGYNAAITCARTRS